MLPSCLPPVSHAWWGLTHADGRPGGTAHNTQAGRHAWAASVSLVVGAVKLNTPQGGGCKRNPRRLQHTLNAGAPPAPHRTSAASGRNVVSRADASAAACCSSASASTSPRPHICSSLSSPCLAPAEIGPLPLPLPLLLLLLGPKVRGGGGGTNTSCTSSNCGLSAAAAGPGSSSVLLPNWPA
jgi:hypothetical protein